jgi:hypothetical protein
MLRLLLCQVISLTDRPSSALPQYSKRASKMDHLLSTIIPPDMIEYERPTAGMFCQCLFSVGNSSPLGRQRLTASARLLFRQSSSASRPSACRT